MTGADEHGQKIAETAQRQGATPMELCDQYVSKFKARRGGGCALHCRG
jgi:methionyl-tRNA synthetase